MVNIKKNLKKELVYFSLIGLISVLIDFQIYSLLNYLGFKLYFSKGLGFWVGVYFHIFK